LKKEINNSKPQKQQVSSIIEDEAARLGIPQHANLLTKLAKQESGFKQSAVSPKGALGVMQLMPATAQELGVDPTDLEQNVRGGVRYWAKQLRFFNGDTKLATAAYNAGAGNVIKAGNQVPNFKETQNYVAAIVG
jgi:soluble lytic murein transglycosylase-like protein